MAASPCLLAQGPGQWQSDSVPPALPPWRYVNPPDAGLGCWMNASVLRQRNVMRFAFGQCPMKLLDKAALCGELAGRELLFVGDSLQGHLYLEFYMMLNETLSTNRGICAKYTCKPRRICTDHVDGGVPMTMVRDDWLAINADDACEPGPPSTLLLSVCAYRSSTSGAGGRPTASPSFSTNCLDIEGRKWPPVSRVPAAP